MQNGKYDIMDNLIGDEGRSSNMKEMDKWIT
jgi:hypothetical protein